MLEGGAGYAEVADWLNSQGIRPGPYCRSSRWSVSRVRQTTFNPIIKGLRVRNKKMSKRVNKTGRTAQPARAHRKVSASVPERASV